WISFAELDTSEATVEVMLPTGSWATFTFQANSSASDVNYRHNLTAEKQGPSPGGVTNIVLHYPDGSQAAYSVYDGTDTFYAGLFYRSSRSDPVGNTNSFAYDENFFLTNVTAADGTSF